MMHGYQQKAEAAKSRNMKRKCNAFNQNFAGCGCVACNPIAHTGKPASWDSVLAGPGCKTCIYPVHQGSNQFANHRLRRDARRLSPVVFLPNSIPRSHGSFQLTGGTTLSLGLNMTHRRKFEQKPFNVVPRCPTWTCMEKEQIIWRQ